MADAGAATASTASADMSSFKIYTKTGDKGTSQLFSGDRLPKDNEFFHALGDVDELNCAIGVAREFTCAVAGKAPMLVLASQLESIQSLLFDVGSAVATPPATSSEAKQQRTAFDGDHTATLEGWIDSMSAELPPLKNFILPSGGNAGAALHMARAICRRAERSVVCLTRQEAVVVQVAVFLNRLSDYLFTAARFAAHSQNLPEVIWRKTVAAPKP